MSDWTEHWRSDDVYLWKNEPGYVSTEFTYASPHFNGARDMYDLADRATALKAVLDGAMMLGVGSLLHSYEPFALGQIVDLGDQTKLDGPGLDRKSVVQGKSVSVRVYLGGGSLINKKHHVHNHM